MNPSGRFGGAVATTGRGFAAILALGLVAPPLLAVAGGALASGADVDVLPLLLRTRTASLLLTSVLLAAGVTVLATLAGTLLGLGAALVRVPLLRVWAALHAAPLALPPFLSALGWFHVWGRQGWLGDETTSHFFFGPAGVVLVLTIALCPIVTAFTWSAARGLDADALDAARLAMPARRVVTRIVLPLVAPAVATAALLVFALSLSELSVPAFLRVDVYPGAVFARLGGLDYAPGEAALLSLPQLLLAAFIAVALVRISRSGRVATSALRRGTALRRDRAATRFTAALWVLAASVALLPLLALFAALQKRHLGDALAHARAGAASSLWIAAVATVLGLTMALVPAHALSMSARHARALVTTALVAFLIPSAVYAVGVITILHRPSLGAIAGTQVPVILALCGRYLVVAIVALAVAFRQTPASWTDAARVAGAGYWRRLLRILLPANRPALIFAAAALAVLILRDIDTAILLYPPGGSPLPVRIFTLEANGAPGLIAGLCLAQVVLMLLVVVPAGVLFRRALR